MLEDGLSAEDAAEAAMAEVGPDPYYDAEFLSYRLREHPLEERARLVSTARWDRREDRRAGAGLGLDVHRAP